MLKCTGGKGLHVTVPLAEKDDWAAVKAFASALAHEMAEAVPSAYIATMTKAKLVSPFCKAASSTLAASSHFSQGRNSSPVPGAIEPSSERLFAMGLDLLLRRW